MNNLRRWRYVERFQRCLHATTALSNKVQLNSKLEWQNAVKDAERVVGYPTSFLNLRWLLSDEVANVASHLRKLIGTGHPLLKTVKDFFLESDKPAWGLVVLLISRAGGIGPEATEMETDRTAGILHSQRVIAEVTEMIRTSVMIHRVMMQVKQKTDDSDILLYGNKISLLGGDYLLSRSYKDLGDLRNTYVNEIISSGLRDLTEYEFLGRKDEREICYPEPPTDVDRISKIQSEDEIDFGPFDARTCLGNPREEWILRNLLLGASLLGKSCRAVMMLAAADEQMRNQAYLFGKHLGLAWQAKYDYEDFEAEKCLNLVGAPVLMALSECPDFYEDITGKCDAEKIRQRVRELKGLERTRELQDLYAERALRNLESFKDSDAVDALKRIVGVM